MAQIEKPFERQNRLDGPQSVEVSNLAGRTLVYFIHRLLDIREAELLAVTGRLGQPEASASIGRISDDDAFSPLRVLGPMSDEKAAAIGREAVLVKVRIAHVSVHTSAQHAAHRSWPVTGMYTSARHLSGVPTSFMPSVPPGGFPGECSTSDTCIAM